MQDKTQREEKEGPPDGKGAETHRGEKHQDEEQDAEATLDAVCFVI